ncbi:MAG: methyltransferase domain-containing protein [Anaerolineales bacterium]|nr:methyltransferase domain-containing protein [Anaerolineales bacterium]
MQYKYAIERADYSDLASGRVFHSLPGHPAFPIRLASEIFQRCVDHRSRLYQASGQCTLYDPCCGAAYHLSVLAYLHGEHLQEVIGSDINEKAVALAQRNLSLLDIHGLDQRIAEISSLLQQYGKDSHREAMESAAVLKTQIVLLSPLISMRTFQANATEEIGISKSIKEKSVDIVFTDIPYGQHSNWEDTRSDFPAQSMLNALKGFLSSHSVVAIVSDKRQKVLHEGYQRIEHFQIGKRRVVILKPG